MHVCAFTNGSADATDVLAIFDHRLAHIEILQCNLMAERNVLAERAAKFTIVLGYHAEHFRACDEILDNDHADVIVPVMYEQLRLVFQAPRVPSRGTYDTTLRAHEVILRGDGPRSVSR